MSSTIFYRFKSQKDYSRVSFDASQLGLTVFDIKRDIIQTEKLGAGTDFDLRISNADSNQEYEDDAEIVPRGTSVIVQRKPPSRGPGKGSAARYVTGNSIQVSARQEFKKPVAQTNLPAARSSALPPPPVPGSSEDEAIRAMLLASSDQWQETQDRMALSKPVYRAGARGVPTGPIPDRPLPQGYICYRCGQKGHYIQACPTNGDESFENRKRIKRTTGIPRSQLQKVENPADEVEGNVMVNADGESVMFVPDSASWETYQKNTKTSTNEDVPEDSPLACGICKKLMKQPVSVPCCGRKYCEECIQSALLESDFICPGCGTKDILLDKLVPQPELEGEIQEYLAAKTSADDPETAKDLKGSDQDNATGTDQDDKGAGVVAEDPTTMAGMPPFPMPPFDPMMMGMMGFNPMNFPPMPGMPPMPNMMGMPGFGFPPPMPMPMPMQMPMGGPQPPAGPQRSHRNTGDGARAHPYARPPSGPAQGRQ
ncbi:MPE1 [Taphrina deformans PYCC 5710]|uniref:MPE1 n=1 Tax=Taphrina deformans (strain PYCC 5710 / ATCC 11124 / CBS 356.35 / IMI 108563 / JCM 9778 / NBRC 8474) TaxID=1097556 RepID=R4XH77_TAPDE|nr:MPE1 [Taphrina deformans PYCC 5710]|eukprot:CCG82746.1 MPE1 [Taphrina deformans PYCC 5710]